MTYTTQVDMVITLTLAAFFALSLAAYAVAVVSTRISNKG